MPEGIPGMSSQTIWTRSEYGFTEPVMIDATIYFSLYNSEGYVFAQHSLSGADKWRYKLPGVIFSPVAVAGGAVLAGASDGTLLAISAITGQLIWSKAQKGHEFHTAAPLVANGVVYFSSTEYSAQESVRPKGRVFALELGTGKQLWVYQNRAVVGAAAFADQTLFVGDSEGNLHAIDISTGQERWKFKSSGGAVLQPAIKNGVVYFPAHDGSLHAVDALSGQERWKNTKEPKVATALVLDESDIYFGGERLNLYAVDGSSGQLKWVYKTKDQCHRPVLAAGTVCFTTGNVMQALDTKTGAEKWKVVELSKTVSAPILASDSIYFLDVEGHLYALK
jgi:outer membrane protein assembly factor BamB